VLEDKRTAEGAQRRSRNRYRERDSDIFLVVRITKGHRGTWRGGGESRG